MTWTGAHWFAGARKRVSHGMLKIVHKPLRPALERSADSAPPLTPAVEAHLRQAASHIRSDNTNNTSDQPETA